MLHQLALDTLTIPAMSTECERVFSSAKKLLTPSGLHYRGRGRSGGLSLRPRGRLPNRAVIPEVFDIDDEVGTEMSGALVEEVRHTATNTTERDSTTAQSRNMSDGER
jgi:hypothetical protein